MFTRYAGDVYLFQSGDADLKLIKETGSHHDLDSENICRWIDLPATLHTAYGKTHIWSFLQMIVESCAREGLRSTSLPPSSVRNFTGLRLRV